ncbi:MAG: LacI family DNA-binding transcriptional regulator [Planctomycetota bacterium]
MANAKKKLPRLKDVAAAAKVSPAAASRILSGDDSEFAEATCQRVIETARKLGWRRNLLVKSIQQGATKTIGVMIPPHDSFWVGVIAGIHLCLTREDYLPITVWIGDGRETPDFGKDAADGVEQINRLLDRRVDGLILWPGFAAAFYQHYRELVEKRIPVVVIDHERSDEDLADSIETDESLGASIAADHLLGLGHRRIACFSARETTWQAWAVRRRTLFEKAVKEKASLEVTSWTTNAEGTDGPEVASEIIRSRPTAVFAVTDHQARLLYRAAAQEGVRVPDDLSVLGYADLDFASELSPGLTTIRQQPDKIGMAAAESILGRLKRGAATEQSQVQRIPVELVVRESTSEPPAARG